MFAPIGADGTVASDAGNVRPPAEPPLLRRVQPSGSSPHFADMNDTDDDDRIPASSSNRRSPSVFGSAAPSWRSSFSGGRGRFSPARPAPPPKRHELESEHACLLPAFFRHLAAVDPKLRPLGAGGPFRISEDIVGGGGVSALVAEKLRRRCGGSAYDCATTAVVGAGGAAIGTPSPTTTLSDAQASSLLPSSPPRSRPVAAAVSPPRGRSSGSPASVRLAPSSPRAAAARGQPRAIDIDPSPLRVPDSVVLARGAPVAWYYTDHTLGILRRRHGADLEPNTLYASLSETTPAARGICAVYWASHSGAPPRLGSSTSDHPPSGGGFPAASPSVADSTADDVPSSGVVAYALEAPQLRELLFDRGHCALLESYPNGVLQRYVPSLAPSRPGSVLEVMWTPAASGVYPLQLRTLGESARVTPRGRKLDGGVGALATDDSMKETISAVDVYASVFGMLGWFVPHLLRNERRRVTRFCGLFRLDDAGGVWLLGATSLRVEEVAEPTAAAFQMLAASIERAAPVVASGATSRRRNNARTLNDAFRGFEEDETTLAKTARGVSGAAEISGAAPRQPLSRRASRVQIVEPPLSQSTGGEPPLSSRRSSAATATSEYGRITSAGGTATRNGLARFHELLRSATARTAATDAPARTFSAASVNARVPLALVAAPRVSDIRRQWRGHLLHRAAPAPPQGNPHVASRSRPSRPTSAFGNMSSHSADDSAGCCIPQPSPSPFFTPANAFETPDASPRREGEGEGAVATAPRQAREEAQALLLRRDGDADLGAAILREMALMASCGRAFDEHRPGAAARARAPLDIAHPSVQQAMAASKARRSTVFLHSVPGLSSRRPSSAAGATLASTVEVGGDTNSAPASPPGRRQASAPTAGSTANPTATARPVWRQRIGAVGTRAAWERIGAAIYWACEEADVVTPVTAGSAGSEGSAAKGACSKAPPVVVAAVVAQDDVADAGGVAAVVSFAAQCTESGVDDVAVVKDRADFFLVTFPTPTARTLGLTHHVVGNDVSGRADDIPLPSKQFPGRKVPRPPRSDVAGLWVLRQRIVGRIDAMAID